MGNVNSAGDIQTSGVVNNTEVKGQNIKNATGSSDAPNPQSEVDTKSISGRDAIANASPEAQAMVMNELITQVKEGKYVTSLSFWDNFCAWIESIFTNHDRVEILLDKFFDAISNNKQESFIREAKKYYSSLRENEDDFYVSMVLMVKNNENLRKIWDYWKPEKPKCECEETKNKQRDLPSGKALIKVESYIFKPKLDSFDLEFYNKFALSLNLTSDQGDSFIKKLELDLEKCSSVFEFCQKNKETIPDSVKNLTYLIKYHSNEESAFHKNLFTQEEEKERLKKIFNLADDLCQKMGIS